jgi:hypothetical protein
MGKQIEIHSKNDYKMGLFSHFSSKCGCPGLLYIFTRQKNKNIGLLIYKGVFRDSLIYQLP